MTRFGPPFQHHQAQEILDLALAAPRRLVLIPVSVALLSVLAGAAPSGYLSTGAGSPVSQLVARPRDDEDDRVPLLLIPPQHADSILFTAGHRSHRSHSSHQSHRSASSHWNHYSATRGGPNYDYTPPPPPSRHGGGGKGSKKAKGTRQDADRREGDGKPTRPVPKQARIAFLAYPGGQVFVDGKKVGHDLTPVLKLKPGTHKVKIVNKYLGTFTKDVTIESGQRGAIVIEW